MTHAGQEITLCAVGHVGRIFGALQLLNAALQFLRGAIKRAFGTPARGLFTLECCLWTGTGAKGAFRSGACGASGLRDAFRHVVVRSPSDGHNHIVSRVEEAGTIVATASNCQSLCVWWTRDSTPACFARLRPSCLA